mmetsp:Transcript_9970/g.15149  ORF Transcript_9970/g.15149 Transcript_9970/m.15149 type:complete len:837 (-) Transcript_9970:1113-3623(-)
MDESAYSRKSSNLDDSSEGRKIRKRRPSQTGSANGDSRTAPSATSSILHTQHTHQQIQAFFSIIVIIVCIVDLYALAPRLAFSGTPRNDDFQRVLFWLQQTSSIIFIISYTIGMILVRTNRLRKIAEAKRHASRHTQNHMIQEKTGLFDLDSPPVLITQIMFASLLPIITDFAMWAQPKSRRHWKWIGTLRLLHLVGFRYVFSTLDMNLTIPHWAPPTLRNTLLLFFNTHWAACVFWWLARRKDYSTDTWVGAHADFLIESSTNTQYLYSLYYAVITASTVGYGDYSPVSSSEVTVMITYVLMNVLLVANIVGGVSALATMHDTDIAEQRIRIARFSRMLKNENISQDVALATTEYLRLGLKMMSFDARCDIDSLPVSVRIRIRDERFGHLIETLPLFRGVSHRFLAKCVAIAKDEAFVKGLEIIRTGDLSARLFIILSGHATIPLPTDYASCGHLDGPDNLSTDHIDQEIDMSGETCSVLTLGTGALFGAEGFVCQLQQPWTIVAKSLLRVITFDDTDREELEATFPNDWFKVQSNLLKMTQAIYRGAQSLASTHDEAACDIRTHHPFTHNASPANEIEKDDATNVINLTHVSGKANKAQTKYIDELKLSIEANILHPNVICGFAAATNVLTSAINRETTKASHELSALHCHIAASGDDAELGRLLDMVPIEVVPGDYDGRTPLHLASAQGHVECVLVLLEHGANVNPIDRFGRTPLQEAVLNGHDQIITTLLQRGGELKLSQQEIASRLCDASAQGSYDTVKRYLDAGASPNAADYDLRTALMLSAAEGNTQVCKLLIQRGATKVAKDRWGHTAYDEAIKHGHTGTLANFLKGD